MRLMRTEDEADKYTSPCSKADLLKGIKACPEYDSRDFLNIDKHTRTHLIDIAADLDILLDLEERSLIIKILKSSNLYFKKDMDTYTLVQIAVDAALDRYGVADLEALGKNRKYSSFCKIV